LACRKSVSNCLQIVQLNSELNSQRQAYSEKVEKLEEEIQTAKSNVSFIVQ